MKGELPSVDGETAFENMILVVASLGPQDTFASLVDEESFPVFTIMEPEGGGAQFLRPDFLWFVGYLEDCRANVVVGGMTDEGARHLGPVVVVIAPACCLDFVRQKDGGPVLCAGCGPTVESG